MHFPYDCPLIDGECSCPELPEFGNGLLAEIERRQLANQAQLQASIRAHRESIAKLLLEMVEKDPSLLDIAPCCDQPPGDV